MKKRNWLMTIAFAVLSLTIVSTMVIGSTYAKFVSQVTGNGEAQAAGFLVAGTVANTEINTIMAPGVTADQSISLKYFSQVATQITDANTGSAGSLAATGVFTTETWNTLVTFYNTNWTKIANALGYSPYDGANLTSGYNGGLVKSGLAPYEVLTVTAGEANSNRTIAQEFIKQVFTDVKAADSTHAIYAADAALSGTNNDIIPAMLPTASEVKTATLTVHVTWDTPVVYSNASTATETANDLFDTFIGNCIAAIATGQDLVYNYYANSTATTTTPLYVIGTNGTPAESTYALAKPATATTSTIGVSIGLKAEQYVANNG